MKDMMENKLDKLRDEVEKRELAALQRRTGTEIRLALVEREALPASYHKQVAEECERNITELLERISKLFPAREAELFIDAFTTEEKNLKAAKIGVGILSLIMKIMAVPGITNEIDLTIQNSLEPIHAANRSKKRLAEEGIDVGEFIPYPTFIPNDMLGKIGALKLILHGLPKARAYFSWLESLLSRG